MPQIMVEAFAKSLINKIMLEAFDLVDTHDEKLHRSDNQEETSDTQSQSIRTNFETYAHLNTDCSETETTELIEKMVHGLCSIQIGDAVSVSPPLSKLEKRVKNVICNISNVHIIDPTKTAETQMSQGQGDVHQIIHDALINAPTDTASSIRKEKEESNSSEAARVSANLLHRMIEELEMKNEDSDPDEENKHDSISKGEIAAWEETQEQFLRTIESVDDTDHRNINILCESDSKNHVCDLVYKGSMTSLPLHSKSLAKSICSEEVEAEQITSLPSPTDNSSPIPASENYENIDESKLKRQKKKGLLNRMFKTLRVAFRRKH